MRLTASDYDALARCYITPALADAAGLYRVDSLEGRDLVGRKGGGNYAGIVYPVIDPVTHQTVANFLRLDEPPVDIATGKPSQKYLCAPGQRNKILMSLEEVSHLKDPKKPVFIVEGPKKYVAVHRAALEAAALRNGDTAGPLWVTIAFSGVWNWRGTIAITTDSKGRRVPVKGPIPDLDKLTWTARPVIICYDSNTAVQEQVRQARHALARHLSEKSAQVFFIDLPAGPGINGPDDFLGASGLKAFLDLWDHPTAWDWYGELLTSDRGKVLPLLANVLTALRLAPEWHGVLGFNEFALQAEGRQTPPWGGRPGAWTDHEDLRTVEWLERKGICVGKNLAADAVACVAREHSFHPVRDYLNRLAWDGTARIDTWLERYLGAGESDYARAVGTAWLISAVARAFQPGVKADHALILEGLQGLGKSTAFEILGGEFYSDDIAQLGTKDASLGTAGVWIVELAELAAMGHAEVEKIKSFLSRPVDHFRPPYARHFVWVPRQCVFGGTVNLNRYLKDETGGRRFWPVECGRMDLALLRADRNQLWAEALLRYQKGEHWWLEREDLIQAATREQEDRYLVDPWEQPIAAFLLDRTAVTTNEILSGPLQKEIGQWTRGDEIRVGMILNRLGWEATRRENTGTRRRIYEEKATARPKSAKSAKSAGGDAG